MSASHVAVVGAGIAGLSCAFRLAEQGHKVTVFDPYPASGATHHAGGMLAPAAEVIFQQEALFPLMQRSKELYPEFLDALAQHTCMPTGHRTEGTLVVAADRADMGYLKQLTALQRGHGFPVSELTGSQARQVEPWLSPRIAGAVDSPEDHQVAPRFLAAALLDACQNLGVEFVARSVSAVSSEDGFIRLTTTDTNHADQTHTFDEVVLATGVEVSRIAGPHQEMGMQLREVFGEMIRLAPPTNAQVAQQVCKKVIRGVVASRPVYIIPRTDGTVAIGATTREDARDNPPLGCVHQLIRDAIRLLPALEEYELLEVTTGARPGTPDDLPYVGRVDTHIVVATGLFRHGILLAPWVAEAVCALIEPSVSAETSRLLQAADPARHKPQTEATNTEKAFDA